MNNTFQNVHIIKVTPGEQSKSLKVYEMIISELLVHRYSRNLTIVSIGGGVIGDLAGFIASSYLRGVKFIQVPTTLLSQIDSSIGGKVAINFNTRKNVIGAFYHPDLVLIDPLFLNTLSKRQFNNGMAELIKYALIKDKDLFNKIMIAESINNIDDFIYQALIIKKEIVEKDELDHHTRHLLNFGHTIGHAIESYYQFDKYLHGEAVAIGMAMITRKNDFHQEIVKILTKYNLPTTINIEPHKLFEFMQNDKKKTNTDTIKIVLLKKIGQAYLKTIRISDIIDYL